MIKLIESAIRQAEKRGGKPRTILIDKNSFSEFKNELNSRPVVLMFSALPKKNEEAEVKPKKFNILGDDFEFIELDTEEFTLMIK